MTKKAIITGATGFVGSYLCHKLIDDNWNVAVIVRDSSDLTNIENILYRLQIFHFTNQLDYLIKFFIDYQADVVFHLASLFIAEHQPNQIDALVESNLRFGLYILEAMSHSQTNLIINAGTSWQNYTSSEYDPVDLYAATKEAFEKLMKYYINARGTRAITLKLYDTYGEYDRRPKLINLLKQYAHDGTILKVSPGNQMINLVHVDDAVNAFIKAYEYLACNIEISYQVFFVRSNHNLSLRGLIQLFEEVSGEKLNVEWGGRPYRKREVMNVYEEGNLLPNWECKISLAEGINKLIKSSDFE